VKTFSGEIGAALSAFAVLFGLAAIAFFVAFLLSRSWIDLAVVGVFSLVSLVLWQLSMRRTVLAGPAVRARGSVRRRRGDSSPERLTRRLVSRR
jgi:membrane protein implicated in regulation of membrane protease activity